MAGLGRQVPLAAVGPVTSAGTAVQEIAIKILQAKGFDSQDYFVDLSLLAFWGGKQ